MVDELVAKTVYWLVGLMATCLVYWMVARLVFQMVPRLAELMVSSTVDSTVKMLGGIVVALSAAQKVVLSVDLKEAYLVAM